MSNAIRGAPSAACLALATVSLTACSAAPAAPPVDAATVRLAVVGDDVVGADSRLACILRTVPADDAARVGAVADCTNPVDRPVDLRLSLAPGNYIVQASRYSCPGMPGECSEDAYDQQYDTSDAVWACDVSISVGPLENSHVRVDVVSDPAVASCTGGP